VARPSEAPPPAVTELVGRDAELQAVRDAFAATPSGGILLEGDAGIGKTALWSAGIAGAETQGMRVLVARPAEAESTLSHATLGDLLAPLAAELSVELPEPQRQALEVALLRSPAPAGPVDPHAVGAATLAMLAAASRRTPVLVAVDDIQWLDSASAAAVAFALRRLAHDPVVLLGTRRLGPGAEWIDTGLPEERLTRIPVGPLGLEALQRIVYARLGEPVPRPAAARLAEVSGGNPYYALELARAARRAQSGVALGAGLPLPDGIYVVLQDRLRALPPVTQEALGAVAAMGHPTTAAAAAAVDAGALDPAFAAGVLVEQADSIHFEHPLLAEAAYRLLPPGRRRAVHERLAELATDVEQRARHLAAASTAPAAAVAADIEAGAEAAAMRGAPAAAAELLEASAHLEPAPESAARRRIAAMRQHTAAGDGRRAKALADTLLEELPAGPLRARVLVARSEQEGPIDEALAMVTQAVTEAGDDVEALIEALLSHGMLLSLSGRDEEGHRQTERAYRLCDPSTPRGLLVKATARYAEFAQWLGEPNGMQLLREAAELEGDDLIPDAYWGPGAVLGRTLVFADELEEGRRLLEGRYRRAREVGDEESRAGLALHLAELEIKDGRLDAALAYAQEGLAIQEGSYAEEAQGSLSYVLALVRAYQGNIPLARELGEQGLRRCESQGDVLFAGIHRAMLGFLELSTGDSAAAVERMWPLVEQFMAGPVDPGFPHTAGMPDLVEALTALDRLDEAEALLEAWDQAGERFDRPRVRATSARCRALIAAARGDLETAVPLGEVSVARFRELPLPFDRARSLIVLGSLCRRTRKKAAARAALEEALEILDGIGARLWSERARAELARIGGRARAGGLTPTEERVAELVASGRSNKEVADALFVSVRTVEANLTRIYAKLGIRSRTELASRRGH
jgi:DNA-binding CsgD family transcriptional regulator